MRRTSRPPTGPVRFVVGAAILLAVAAGLLLTRSHRRPVLSSHRAPILPVFEDVAVRRGLRFRHHTGATGRYFLPETMGSGCAFVDFYNDGYPAILLLNGKDWAGRQGMRHTLALYRNDHGRFTDVTRRSGLDVELYAMGVAAADYDNDGYVDLYITCVGGNHLFRNERGHFVDVTGRARVGNAGRWSTGAAWLDYDRDGKVDLFVANYVAWTPATDKYCTLTGKRKSYCTPQDYDGVACTLYHNRGDGTFEDVSRQAGIGSHVGKSLGVLALDYDDDGWPDIFVANDTEPNFLFRNAGKGRFEEVGLQAGFALGDTGRARAGMGLDAADIDHSGQAAIAVTNFAGEGVGLFATGGDGLFSDEAASRNVRGPTTPFLGFGVCFLDANMDGWPDLFVANGHVDDDVASFRPEQRYAQSPLLMMNEQGRFFPVQAVPAPGWMAPMVARGAAVADFDLDGRPDILISANGGSPRLLRNATPGSPTWLRIQLQGTSSNRSAIGARVRVRTGSLVQTQWVRAGSSYCSQNELPLTFSLAGRDYADEVQVRWPSGISERWTTVPSNTRCTLIEGQTQPQRIAGDK